MSSILISYIFKRLLPVLLVCIVSFVFTKIYPIKSFVLRTFVSFFIVIIILFASQQVYRIIYPLDVYDPSVEINTIDNSNPKDKTLTYKARVYNRTNKDVDIILIFTKIDSDLYPYINLIPETYTSNKITLKENEKKEFETTITIDSEDKRLINSYWQKIEVKYVKQ
jgi:hypothetical protein